jgi:undecaprenyl-phosphate 4-deoxy-4-formamido-L-arabinose transferase
VAEGLPPDESARCGAAPRGPTTHRRGQNAMDIVDVSVVIPVYNSADMLSVLYRRLRAVLAATGKRFEVVLVDDGSQDDSWAMLEQLQALDPNHVVAIQLMRNFGQHNALMCGFRHARGQFIITMDDDLQHPPEEIPKLLTAIERGDLDLVYGAYDRKQHGAAKNLASQVVNLFYRLVFNSPVTVTAFRVIRRELLETVLSYSLNFTFVDGLLAWNTRRIGEVSVAHHPRALGRSGYRFGKLLTLALNLFTNFSLLPLQFVSFCGVSAALMGFVLGLYYFYQHLASGITVPGYASTIVSILVLGGLQLLGLGIMGEYVGRLHLNVNRKPQYSVRNVVSAARAHEKGAWSDGNNDSGRGFGARAA